jgi:tRNA threonylcarbamoyladenosine biosynthesis protein TsaE
MNDLKRTENSVLRMNKTTWTFEADDEAATERLGITLAKSLPRPAVVALNGTLGAGKTRLVQAIALGLGIDPRIVTSPTYVLLHEYPGETPIFHFDAYRLRSDEEFWQLGAEEYLSGDARGVAIIEWADRVVGCFPDERLEISIEVTNPTARRFTIASLGARYDEAVKQLKRALE